MRWGVVAHREGGEDLGARDCRELSAAGLTEGSVGLVGAGRTCARGDKVVRALYVHRQSHR